MIFDVHKNKIIDSIPHIESFELIQMTLTEQEIQSIEDEINTKLDKVNIVNAGFMPGSDWRGTPFQVLFDRTADKNFRFASLLFGLMVWVTIQKREDLWSFGNYHPYDLAKTYFRIDQ
jgi:hypothetical protein